jgi:hypothetical protein
MPARLITIVGVQLYALLLAVFQWHIGVRTDEAKYLLDIPYPHPPLARWILSLLDGWQYQEIFWRVVFATLAVQSVWLVLDLVRTARPSVRLAVSLCWLLSAAIIMQAGTIMMAVLTALQALVFVWLFLRDREPVGRSHLIALFWLGSLFTAYQAVLFAPLMWAILGRAKTSVLKRAVLIGLPLVLLGLYTLSNPLAAASLVSHAGDAPSLHDRLNGLLVLWAVGGGLTLSAIGTAGLLKKPTIGLTLSFALVSAYVFLSPADYYAILFTPFLVGGAVLLFRYAPPVAVPVAWLMPVGAVLSLSLASIPPASTARAVYDMLGAHNGTVLMSGSFGHEWQYETTQPVLRYSADRLPSAGVVICLAECEEMSRQTGWERLDGTGVEVWVRDR